MFAGLGQVIVGVAWLDVDRRRGGGRGVIGRVGRRERHRQRLAVAGLQDGARGRGVGECARDAFAVASSCVPPAPCRR